MLQKLIIKNLVLVDFAEIHFSSGLNILTGESGAGKSAILTALGLVIGRKATTELIRENETVAWAEAVFSFKEQDEIKEILDEEGILFPENGTLHLRRELSRNGKNRCFVEDQISSLSALKKIGRIFLQIADQNSHDELGSEPYQRSLLDLYAGLSPDVSAFARSYQKEKKLEETIRNILSEKEGRNLKKERYEVALLKINETALKEGEEEQLSEEHNLLLHAQEVTEKTESIYSSLRDPLLPRLAKIEQLFQSLAKIHPRFKESLELVKNARIELDEASHLVLQMRGSFESDPTRVLAIDERLKAIESLKKKHGANFLAIEEKKKSLLKDLQVLSSNEEDYEELQKKIAALKKENDTRALSIQKKRKEAALILEKKISLELEDLNLSQGKFQIQINPAERTSSGEDHILFLFSANKGETLKAVGHVASGGELSRLLLAFQSILAEKAGSQTLLFDEIDSNVGGKTAAMIGEKLSKLSSFCQILSVTHFVQVAQFASAHFLVKKIEQSGRMITFIEKLSKEARDMEFKRMVGR